MWNIDDILEFKITIGNHIKIHFKGLLFYFIHFRQFASLYRHLSPNDNELINGLQSGRLLFENTIPSNLKKPGNRAEYF